jgi:acyl-CoA thioesterase-2
MPATAVGRLLKLLDLDRLDRDLCLGSPGPGTRRLFGGLVAAQSVVAAYRTVEEGYLHSLHAYFLRPGTHEVPIRYVVYRIRDGRTYTTRNVVAYQAGEAIFNVSCSFTRPEQGVSSQLPGPDVEGPEGMPLWEFERPDRHGDFKEIQRWINQSPVEVRSAKLADPAARRFHRMVWMKPKGPLPEDPVIHAAFLTYSTDMGLLSTARTAYGMDREASFMASLDHVVWFHRTPRFDDWVLYTSDSPVAHSARALILAQMHRRDGTQIATVVQEGLVRLKDA